MTTVCLKLSDVIESAAGPSFLSSTPKSQPHGNSLRNHTWDDPGALRELLIYLSVRA